MTTLNKSTQEELRRIVDQIERLQAEISALQGDVKDKYLEAKGRGFDVKILRKILSLRKKSATDRAEEEALLSVYLAALSMDTTPLGGWAKDRDGLEAH